MEIAGKIFRRDVQDQPTEVVLKHMKEVKNMANTTTIGGSDLGYDMSLWYDSRPLKIGWFAMLAAVGAEVVFQRVFGYLPRLGFDDAGVRERSGWACGALT